MQMKSNSIEVNFNTNGSIESLISTINPKINWVLANNSTFGLPFVNGSQSTETYLTGNTIYTESEKSFNSESKECFVKFHLNEDLLSFTSQLPLHAGPRSGIDFSFNLLDSPDDKWTNQCMPHVIYTAEDQSFCYIIFFNPDGGYLTWVVDEPFAAWRIKYSPNGHKMVGFQLLNEADDIVGKNLPLTENLSGHIFFSEDLSTAYDRLCDILETTIISFDQSGALVGNKLPLIIHGASYADCFQIIDPQNNRQTVSSLKQLSLSTKGTYTLLPITKGRCHQTKILAHDYWQDLLHRSSDFYRKNFQDKTGAFYRVIWRDSLSPAGGITYEGIDFGNPQKMISCKTGEFGGFAGWLMIKAALSDPSDEAARLAAEKYIESWALNLDHPDKPLPGTIAAFPQEFGGRKFGAYHVYHDFNYPQYEIFLIEQLVDYYHLTKKDMIRDYVIKIGRHFVKEHINDQGAVWCQNKSTSIPRDYSTVHTPVTGLHKLATIAFDKDQTYFLKTAEKLADHICQRGLNFPTEGEQSTEDGSMACSALSLLYAYKHIQPKKEYLNTAKLILDKHRVLELNGADSRLFYSSLRFWETMYETRSWGPSINGGHAWSLWTAEAKLLYSEITDDYQAFKEAYCGFMATLSNMDENGGIFCCYTPDMLPGKPHSYDLYLENQIEKGNFIDLYETSTKFAQSQPTHSYSTSGTYTLIKATEYWNRIAGIDFTDYTAINGLLENTTFTLAIENEGTLLINGLPEEELFIILPPENTTLKIKMTPDQFQKLTFLNCEIIKIDGGYSINKIQKSFSIKPKK
ncbi:hypothetical protein KUA55_09695 [Enterococcus sp. ALS3]|uniref:Alpha-L-rhamnosidase six-hairpin glycosidase domain-containing protein n=1 Tax=Enterococcus alishanensis TaxID=1303817 RepID=A0ABS6TDH5_9ENTE|nr:hypothetical protein [Enterococcus alishanensis]MBV7390955.1 hypothetical protein [Enterococcus alishanensis]